METMYLRYFTQDTNYPFNIQYGFHEEDLYMHTHADFSELVIVLNGTAMHRVDKEAYFIKKGDVFVISNNTSHGYDNAYDFRICNIMYRPDQLQSSDLDIRKLAGFHALFVIEPYFTMERSFQSRLKLPLDDFEEVHRIIARMIQEYEHKKYGWKTFLNSQFMMLVVLLSRAYSLTSFDVKEDVINIAKSLSYIERHYKEDITIERLAAKSNLSVRHFTRIFNLTYQTTPGNYILTLRMQHACLLLKESNMTISEVAYESGFNDSNYFTRQFRKLFALTPSQYRNQVAGG